MLAVDYSEAGAVGDADGQAIPVSGIATGDTVLAIIAWDPSGADPIGIDASEATVGDGTVTLSTTDTTDMQVWVMWCTPRE